MDLTPLCQDKSFFTIFIAPPAWGKTQMLLTHFQSLEQGSKVLYLAPLRALAEEFSGIIKKNGFKLDRIEKRCESQKTIEEFLNKKSTTILVSTPEKIDLDCFSLIAEHPKVVIIVDELHLFFQWGETFRPLLWEVLITAGSYSLPILALTATMTDEYLAEIKRDFSVNYENIYLVNLGNNTLKYKPNKSHWYPMNWSFGKKLFYRRLAHILEQEGETVLLFVKYRHEVDRYVEHLERRGISVLGCKGGEAERFMNDLKSAELPPRCIVATTTLSHGVNLPAITSLFISYPVENLAFYIQMVGRGGRKGEKYNLYHCNQEGESRFGRILSFARQIPFDMVS